MLSGKEINTGWILSADFHPKNETFVSLSADHKVPLKTKQRQQPRLLAGAGRINPKAVEVIYVTYRTSFFFCTDMTMIILISYKTYIGAETMSSVKMSDVGVIMAAIIRIMTMACRR